jgi:hypothetical protein
LPVGVQIRQVPFLARPDLVKPERCVGVFRRDDAAHRAWRVECVHQLAETQREREAVHQQDSLVTDRDQRGVIDRVHVHWDEVLDVKRAVGALPGRQI